LHWQSAFLGQDPVPTRGRGVNGRWALQRQLRRTGVAMYDEDALVWPRTTGCRTGVATFHGSLDRCGSTGSLAAPRSVHVHAHVHVHVTCDVDRAAPAREGRVALAVGIPRPGSGSNSGQRGERPMGPATSAPTHWCGHVRRGRTGVATYDGLPHGCGHVSRLEFHSSVAQLQQRLRIILPVSCVASNGCWRIDLPPSRRRVGTPRTRLDDTRARGPTVIGAQARLSRAGFEVLGRTFLAPTAQTAFAQGGPRPDPLPGNRLRSSTGRPN
jgi:hypothetical protein